MAGPKVLGKGFSFWPEAAKVSAIKDIIEMYSNGFAGAYGEPEEREALIAENRALTGFGSIEEAATANNWAGSGQGKLVIPFVHVVEAYPGCWPGPGQARGDCVSWSQKNACLGSMVCEVVGNRPDEETGVAERLPEVSREGIKNGVLSTEAIYWWRRHGGDGWSCSAACRVTQRESGLWLRQDYDDLGIDLTTYSGSLAGKFGVKPPTGKIAEAGKLHLARAFAEARLAAARRDALANGYFGSTCGMEGFSSERDSNGVSRRSGSWAHAMASIAFDDRPEIIKLYGDSLELILNSWAIWNKGPRDIFQSARFVPPSKRKLWESIDIVNPVTGNIMIPKGSFWARSRDVANREWLAVSSVNGWPRQLLPDFGGSLAG
jgi:hypothetical protein